VEVIMDSFLEWLSPVVGFLFVLSGVMLALVFYFVAHEARKKKIALRRSIPFEKWYDEHYGIPGLLPPNEVFSVLCLVAKELGVLPTQLLPTDELNKQLALKGVVYDDTAEALILVLNKYTNNLTGSGLTGKCNWRTLDDIIHAVVSRVRESGKPQKVEPEQ
jgi:hypothetical protein